jgi:hypothetical protein
MAVLAFKNIQNSKNDASIFSQKYQNNGKTFFLKF